MKRLDAIWFLAFFGFSSFWILTAAARVGATFDEPLYLEQGREFWNTGSHHELMRQGTMPLPMDVAMLPVAIAERLAGVEFDFATRLFVGRATMLLFWGILLIFARVVGGELGGPWAGRLAMAFLACEPTFLAHAALLTTDIALSALLLPTLWLFARGRGATWRQRVGVPAVMFGVSLLCKASAIVFVPAGILAIEVTRLVRDGALRSWRDVVPKMRPFVRDAVQIGLLGLLLAFTYCGSDFQPQRSWVEWSHRLPEGTLRTVMVPLAENTRIFNNAGVAIARQISHNLRGHGSFILGEANPRAVWYYFPLLLTIKLTLPLLLLPLLVFAVERRSLVNWACLVAAGLLAYSLNCRVQIGIRLILPWIAIGVVGVCAALVIAWSRQPRGWRKNLLAQACCVGLAWNALSAATCWPHGLCYINELWGGAEDGYRLVSDSNYDWGQGVPEIERWLAEHGRPPLDLFAFTTDPRAEELPLRVKKYHRVSFDEFTREVDGRYLAVSTTLLYGAYLDPQSDLVRTLRQTRPVGRTATCLIFDFTRDGVVAAK